MTIAMTPSDAAKILAIAAAFDRRTVGETDALAWADALHDLNPRDCADAVRTHYRATDTWCMPSHVRVIVTAQRQAAARTRKDARTFAAIEAAKSDRLTPAEVHARAEAIRAQVRAVNAARGTTTPELIGQPT